MKINNVPQISFLIPTKNASSFIARTLHHIHAFLESNFKNQYEIILIINGEDPFESSETQYIANQFAKECPTFKICFSETKGKGAALREGFSHAQGKNIFFTDADLPYDLSFFIEAHQLLASGYHFVTGNRRFENSLFTLPVAVLPLAYGRHRIGLFFNKIVRLLFKFKSHDTQAGIKAFSRSLAERVYSLNTCPGFLFDLEFFLVANQNGYKHYELPVHLHLSSEKTTVRLLRESIETASWLSKIYWQHKRKHYRFESDMNLKKDYYITADDWGLSPSINRGILKLAERGIITRVSIMADGLYVKDYLDQLKAVEGIELGMHFNLTYDNHFNSPMHLLISNFNPMNRKKNNLLIEKELERQFELIKKMDVYLSYADGHHHCHIFPGVVNLFSAFLVKQKISEARLPLSLPLIFSKKIPLFIFSILAKKKYDELKITYRPFYYPDFSKIGSTKILRKLLLDKIGHEIITHPSDLADLKLLSIKDHYDHERVIEFNLLNDLPTT